MCSTLQKAYARKHTGVMLGKTYARTIFMHFHEPTPAGLGARVLITWSTGHARAVPEELKARQDSFLVSIWLMNASSVGYRKA